MSLLIHAFRRDFAMPLLRRCRHAFRRREDIIADDFDAAVCC